jgi:hypothetical protein
MANEPARHDGGELRPTEKLVDYLVRRAQEDAGTRNYEIAATQLDRILSAGSAEQMWNADDFDSIGGRDLVDVEQRINSFTVHEGSEQYASPLGHWIMVQAQRLDNGQEITWNTGAPLLIGKLRWLEAAELLGTADAECVIRSTPTPNGSVLKLKQVPQRAVKADAS